MRTSAGRDWQSRLMGDTSSNATGAYAPANWVGLSTTDADPTDADTTMAGEITSGSLARAQGIYAHTLGTASYTITKVFSADQVARVYRAGVFNAPSGGTLVWEDRLDSDTPLRPGDTIQVTQVVSI